MQLNSAAEKAINAEEGASENAIGFSTHEARRTKAGGDRKGGEPTARSLAIQFVGAPAIVRRIVMMPEGIQRVGPRLI